MFGTLDSSKESRRRRSVAFTCGLLSETLLIAAAALLGLVFPEELPEANRHYALTWLAALRPPPPAPVLKPPPKVVRVVVPKLKPLETPALIAPPVAELAVPKVRPTIPSAAVHIPEPPPMPVAQPRPEPKVQIPVHTGLFGGGGSGHHQASCRKGTDGGVWKSTRATWPGARRKCRKRPEVGFVWTS